MKRLTLFTAMVFFLAVACQKDDPVLEEKTETETGLEREFNKEGFLHSQLDLTLQEIPMEDRRIHEITNPSTHNSYNDTHKYEKSNVFDRLPDQFKKGIRAIEIDIHKRINLFKSDDISVYHGKPTNGFNGTRLAHYVLREITDFVKDNPNEIVYLKFETTVSGSDIDKEIRKADLDDYIYNYNSSNPYPKPEEVTATGKNVIITRDIGSEYGGSALPRHTFGGGYSDKDKNKPQSSPSEKKFFTVEYYHITKTFGYGDSKQQRWLNGEGRLPKFVDEVWKLNGKKPWRVIVDFPSLNDGFYYQEIKRVNERQMLKVKIHDGDGNLLLKDKDGKLITWKWDTSYNGNEVVATTSAEASFPMKKSETVIIQPTSDKYFFVPPYLEVTNDGTTDLLQNFVAFPKSQI
ncbi:phosphatidylinositol-specific phospholipase C domain-containing protein [Aureivirga marina]|uniref:phosphatidylinositol-specific phospholipase C domain-containing protein n=1 Tax=Aureivirga marina TaxID=1182451 RepID=UPI0018CBD7D8|nr:phosphatidylinositol-specific phospholipase C domain-containing protein [Aureivirga marina]